MSLNARFSKISATLQNLRAGCAKVPTLKKTTSSLKRALERHEHNLIDLQHMSAVDPMRLFLTFLIRLTKQRLSGGARVSTESKEMPQWYSAGIIVVPWISVARIHKAFRKVGKRPVILYFQDFETTSALSNSEKLKETGIIVQNDYSHSTLTRKEHAVGKGEGGEGSRENCFYY